MAFVIGLLTFVMVLDCIALIFLVLIQLPKKEAGAGLAFGGAATDALFGAGSGTVLTKVTRYAATIFFVLAFVVAVMQKNYHTKSVSTFEKELNKPGQTTSPLSPTKPSESTTPSQQTPTPTTGTTNLSVPGIPAATNAPAPVVPIPAPATNAPGGTAK